MTRQADGKIIVVGYLSVGQTRNAFVARYMSDGAEDLSFGDGGSSYFIISLLRFILWLCKKMGS